MRRSLKYIAFASASVFSCTLMYKTRGENKFGTLYAAADGRSAEVLRYVCHLRFRISLLWR